MNDGFGTSWNIINPENQGFSKPEDENEPSHNANHPDTLDEIELDIFGSEYSNHILSTADKTAVRSNEDDFLEGFYAFKPIVGTVNSVSELNENTDNSDNDASVNTVQEEMSDELTSEDNFENDKDTNEEVYDYKISLDTFKGTYSNTDSKNATKALLKVSDIPEDIGNTITLIKSNFSRAS